MLIWDKERWCVENRSGVQVLQISCGIMGFGQKELEFYQWPNPGVENFQLLV